MLSRVRRRGGSGVGGVVWLAVCCHVARADTPVYPETAVDRPLVRYGGMTSLDVSEDFYTSTQTGSDASGNPTSTTEINHELDLVVGHSFGVFDISARVVGVAAIAAASAQAGCDATIAGSFEWDLPQTTFRYSYVEGIHYTRRLLRLDHRLAVFAGANAYLLEASLTPTNAPASAGTLLGGGATTAVDMQLLPRLVLETGASVSGAIAKSSSLAVDRPAELGGFVQLQQTLHHWDLYANLNLSNVTRSARPFWSAGFVHRWGG
jgi:hypothetical protein